MGLLEKAQQKKLNKTKKHKNIIKEQYEIDKPIEEEKKLDLELKTNTKKQTTKKEKTGLLEKAKKTKKLLEMPQEEEQRSKDRIEINYDEGQASKQVIIDNKAKLDDTVKIRTPKVETPERKTTPYRETIKKEDRELIEERQGFGWKGLGTRRIVMDKSNNDYLYELEEPVLTEQEKEIKDELSRLFKMLSDIDVTETKEEDKEKYLEKTLERIIEDNDIVFDVSRIKKVEKKTHSPILDEEKKDQKKEFKLNLNFFKKKKDNKKTDKKPKEKKKTKGTKKKITLPFKAEKKELTPEEKKLKDKIFYHIFREFLGYGKIDIVMKDEGIEDISCDGYHVPIFIYHKKYDAIPSNIWFENEAELDNFVVRLTQISGKQISVFSPIVDGKLPDGSRLQTTLSKTVTRTSTFTIRKFKEKPLTPIDLIDYKSLSLDMAAYFWLAIEKGASMLLCGGTASGKTTSLNALSLFIPAQHKIISIEDTREVNLPHKNWIAGTTREGFSASDQKTGKDIDMFDLIRAALRQRPKVVIVGEVRGKEAYNLFQAMATGHTSYATVHASDIHTLIQRLENPPISLPRALLTSLDLIVFQNAVDIGGKTVRRMTSVTEVVKLDPDTNQLIFMEPFRWISKTDDDFENTGTSKILNEIKIQNDWTENQIENELENRKKILKWMLKKNIRDYKDVGKVVSQYSKHPDELLKKAEGELKK